jgi:biotin operon repressor/hypoxanthine-guanine phosphoribosyltransferase
MEPNTEEKILTYIKSRGQVTVNDLTEHLEISRQAVHRQISRLQEEGLIYKIGRPPKVFYLISEEKITKEDNTVDEKTKKIIDENFLDITASGQRQEGFEGFINWCLKRKDPLEKTTKEYVETLKKYKPYKKDGLINGMHKIKATFPDTVVDKLFYLDFYSIERFGKTKLGQLLLYAKQSQNRGLIKELVDQIRPQIEELIKKYQIEAVGFIPPTVKREVQLMRELERQLNLTNPKVSLVKVKTPVIVPQKTLNKLEDRIENAKRTIMVDETKKFKVVLLIDDALGSGATINETAKKIKNQQLAETVIGLAITGSFSGFEIISEV